MVSPPSPATRLHSSLQGRIRVEKKTGGCSYPARASVKQWSRRRPPAARAAPGPLIARPRPGKDRRADRAGRTEPSRWALDRAELGSKHSAQGQGNRDPAQPRLLRGSQASSCPRRTWGRRTSGSWPCPWSHSPRPLVRPGEAGLLSEQRVFFDVSSGSWWTFCFQDKDLWPACQVGNARGPEVVRYCKEHLTRFPRRVVGPD